MYCIDCHCVLCIGAALASFKRGPIFGSGNPESSQIHLHPKV